MHLIIVLVIAVVCDIITRILSWIVFYLFNLMSIIVGGRIAAVTGSYLNRDQTW